MHKMASIKKMTQLSKRIEIALASFHDCYCCYCPNLKQFLIPRYIPVLQQSWVERDDLFERYFQLGLEHWEILAFLLLSDGMVLSLCQQKRFLACRGLRRRNNTNDVDAEPAVKSEEKNRVEKVVRIRENQKIKV